MQIRYEQGYVENFGSRELLVLARESLVEKTIGSVTPCVNTNKSPVKRPKACFEPPGATPDTIVINTDYP